MTCHKTSLRFSHIETKYMCRKYFEMYGNKMQMLATSDRAAIFFCTVNDLIYIFIYMEDVMFYRALRIELCFHNCTASSC